MALIDIHTHILYGVDDGAKDINDSMGLLDEEREQGVDQVILTPHYGPKFGHPDTEVLREKFEAIREKAHKYYPEIQLYLGSELYYQQGTVSDLKQGKALTMNGTRYVLILFISLLLLRYLLPVLLRCGKPSDLRQWIPDWSLW